MNWIADSTMNTTSPTATLPPTTISPNALMICAGVRMQQDHLGGRDGEREPQQRREQQQRRKARQLDRLRDT